MKEKQQASDELILVVGKLAKTAKDGGVTVLDQPESRALLDLLLEKAQASGWRPAL